MILSSKQKEELMQGDERTSRPCRRSGLTGFFGLLILVAAILIGVGAWNDSTMNQFGGPSSWQLRLQQAASITATLVLFWSALGVSRTARWLPIALLIAGGGFYAYRFVVFAVLAGSNGYAVARGWFPSSALVPLHLLFYLLAMGVWGLLDRSRARNLLARLARFDVPVIGLMVFFAVWFGNSEYGWWAGRLGLDRDVLWPSAIGINVILRPLLLVGAFYFLHALPDVPRRRMIEWTLAGALFGLVFTLGSWSISCCGVGWWGDVGVDAAIVGLASVILSRTNPAGGLAVSKSSA
jgi:hypothetical protein